MSIVGKYTSIDNHYKSVGDMLGLPAIATEKIDGSNFSVHIYKGGHEFRSRNQKANDQEGSLFWEAIQIIEPKIDQLRGHFGRNEVILYFEIFGRGVQKRINYDHYLEKCPEVINGRSVALIDVAYIVPNETHRKWISPTEIKYSAHDLGFWTPPQRRFDRLSLAHIEDMLAEKGKEGWVVKTVNEIGKPVRNHYGDLMVVKVKTDEFTAYEKGGKKEKKAKPKTPPEIIEFLLERINNGRLHSVYSHGFPELNKEMADMRYLPDIVLNDIKGETSDYPIWEQFDEQAIRKVVAHMLPRTLRTWLLEDNVNETSSS